MNCLNGSWNSGPRIWPCPSRRRKLLVAAAGVEASAHQIEELLDRTEGWPVGLYLAALAQQSGAAIGEDAFGGDDRWISDYLRSELLSRISSDHVNS